MAATATQVYISGQFAVTIMNYHNAQIAAYVGIYNTLLLAVFIYAFAPASGGHMNPLITWATMLCGLCPASRGVIYIIFQTIGGALGGGMLLGSWGKARADAYASHHLNGMSKGLLTTRLVGTWAAGASSMHRRLAAGRCC